MTSMLYILTASNRRPLAQLWPEDTGVVHKYFFLYNMLITCKCKYWVEVQNSGPHQVRHCKVEKILAA